ncbi:MAG TPA: universal stress protein [Kofleriaceae bacterium]|jgi:nucleotide-binding universal stress UspA family protein
MHPLADMDTTESSLPRFRIVAAIDGSEYAEVVLEHAIDQAARHEHPDLHFVTVVRDKADAERARQDLTMNAVNALEVLSPTKVDWRTWVHVSCGKTIEEIPLLAADVAADLLIVGQFGTHNDSLVAGILARTQCPTLVVNLKEDVVGAVQCPQCVAIRAATRAEQLFCEKHAGEPSDRLTSLLPSSTSSVQGGLLL